MAFILATRARGLLSRGSRSLFMLLFFACGRVVYRPLAVDVEGVSVMARSLVLKVLSSNRACSEVSLANVQSLGAASTKVWRRGGDPERRLEAPRIDQPRATLVVYTEDAQGVAIQLACALVVYEEIENGTISLRLSSPTALIIEPWRRRSVPSCSIASSAVAEWRRFSSPTAATTARAGLWSSSGSAPISRTTTST